jgi:predicted RNA-binding protein (TIGR00451 family)
LLVRLFDSRRQFELMLEYEFGRGVARALPKKGLKFGYSRRSGRMKDVHHEGRLFVTIRPNGAIAPTLYGATVLAKSRSYLENSIVVRDEATKFIKEGKSAFCKFVVSSGKHVLPGGEVAIRDKSGMVIGVGKAKMRGEFMLTFNAGVAVKVRGTFKE